MKKRVLCYGDSNTWGYIPGSGERYDDEVRWTGILQKLLGEDYTILEDGISGRTTVYDQQWAQGRNGLKGLAYSLQANKPIDLIVIMLGTNDLSMMTMPFVALGIEEITRTAVHADSIYRVTTPIYRDIPRVLLIAPAPYPECWERLQGLQGCGKREESLRFAQVCLDISQKLGTEYLDAGQYVQVSPVDGTHFTPEDHKQLGMAVAAKIQKIFREETV